MEFRSRQITVDLAWFGVVQRDLEATLSRTIRQAEAESERQAQWLHGINEETDTRLKAELLRANYHHGYVVGQSDLLDELMHHLQATLDGINGMIEITQEYYWSAPEAVRSEWTQEQLRAMRWERFRQTRYWQHVRSVVFEEYVGECDCGLPGTEVHHRHGFTDGYGFEASGDLRLLCGRCHDLATRFHANPGTMTILHAPLRNGQNGKHG